MSIYKKSKNLNLNELNILKTIAMKKNYFMYLILVFSTMTSYLNAQVINGDFETIKSNGLISNWGVNFNVPVSINLENGEMTSDMIIYDDCSSLACIPNPSAQSGQNAIEIRNAFNQTKNEVIAGQAILFEDASLDEPGWNPGVSIQAGVEINSLRFYYKFLPVGNDVAQAKIEILGESGVIGSAIFNISGLNLNYSYADIPVVYNTNEAPLTMKISFSMSNGNSTPSFGSRLIIDNVTTSSTLGIKNNQISNFKIYPTIVDDYFNIVSKNSDLNSFTILDNQGRIVQQSNINLSQEEFKVDVSKLITGIYFVNFNNKRSTTMKFIKK